MSNAIFLLQITMMFLFPTFAQKLFHYPLIDKYDVRSLAKFIVGGGHTPPSVATGLVEKLGLESYRHGKVTRYREQALVQRSDCGRRGKSAYAERRNRVRASSHPRIKQYDYAVVESTE